MIARIVAALFFFACVSASAQTRVLDDFDDVTIWHADHTDDVTAHIDRVDGKFGSALRLNFDFDHVNGYATARRALPLDFPDNYELSFWIRGEAGVNNLQFKLVDASGENVWWINKPDFTFTTEWQHIVAKKRQIGFAWGPTTDKTLKHTASLEFVVSSGQDGGKGYIDIDRLEMRKLPTSNPSPPKPTLYASSQRAGSPATDAMDGDTSTAWQPSGGGEQHLDIDFHEPREFSAVILHWRNGVRPEQFVVRELADNGHWYSNVGVGLEVGDTNVMQTPDGEARHVRIEFRGKANYALSEIEFEPPEWGEDRNALLKHVASMLPRGNYPRGFSEQPYWTIVGVDGDSAPALVSEDGAIEPVKGRFSIEPFVRIGDHWLSWADVTEKQTLQDGYLPMPNAQWKSNDIALDIETFARGVRGESQVVARYTLRNTSDRHIDAELQLAVRPLQVNPPAQFLNSAGGVGGIQAMKWDGDALAVDDAMIWPLQSPTSTISTDGFAGWFDQMHHGDRIRKDISGYSAFGNLGGALEYPISLPPHGSSAVTIVASIDGKLSGRPLDELSRQAWFDTEREKVAADWRAKLDRVQIDVPPQAQRLVDALRTSLAYTLISRDGPALRPGTRAYARTWIRDGAMIEDGLLALGNLEASREFVDWFAPHQFSNGKVPCCVDHRGADPVPENDSHGELIHAIAQLYRYGRDRAELEKNWPHIDAAVAYMDKLRASETGAANPAFKGLMPASISHEGYSSKPMHSYWDDFWALVGYNDAVDMAHVLGRADDEKRIAMSRDTFKKDLLASIASAVASHAIDFLPGSAELGDFDATSSTIAVAQAGVLNDLPSLIRATFERYWKDFDARAKGERDWKDYTPYEWRTVGTFARLGWRDCAQSAINFFFRSGERPPGWNEWAEVVGRDLREIRFIGDMPHIWVASDFIRSTLDLFAYDRAPDHTIVIAAGIPADWIRTGNGIKIANLRTPYGPLAYRVVEQSGHVSLHIDAGISPPGGIDFDSPYHSAKNLKVNDRARAWNGSVIHIDRLPADVSFDIPQQTH